MGGFMLFGLLEGATMMYLFILKLTYGDVLISREEKGATQWNTDSSVVLV
jgi:hypothetical protein